MTTFAVVPVKRFSAAKRRLAGELDADARRALAEAMLADVLVALRRTRSIDRTLVVSHDPRARSLAHAFGALGVTDEHDRSFSSAAQIGIESAIAHGATRALIVPGDCPALVPAELDELLATVAGSTRDVAVVPDRHGLGTNALLLTPPDALAPAFGPGSCARHLEAAATTGAGGRVEHVPSLALDIDTRADLDRLCALLDDESVAALHTRRALACALALT